MKRTEIEGRFNSLVSRLKIYHLIIIFFLFYTFCSIYRHFVFSSGAWDLGIFSQTVWQYSRFEIGYNTIRGVPCLLGDHFHPLLMAFAPLYWIWSDPTLLLIAQALLIAVSAYPIYKVALKKLQDHNLAIIISTAYLCFWGVFQAIDFDFHVIVLMLPLLAFAYYFLEENRIVPFAIAVALMLLVKEDMILIVFALGVYVLIKKKKVFLGLSICLISLGWFYVATKVFIPHLGSSEYGYWCLYSHIAPDFWSVGWKLASNPLLFFKHMFYPTQKILVLAGLLLPFAFLPLFSSFSILAIPYILQRFLSIYPGHWSTHGHYNMVFVVIFSIATIEALSYLKEKRANGEWTRWTRLKKVNARHISYVILCISLALFLVLAGGFFVRLFPSRCVPRALAGRDVLGEIPADASVLTQHAIAPHLANREEIYIYLEKDEEYPLYENLAEYIVLNPQMNSWPIQPEQLMERIEMLKADPRYTCCESEYGWICFRRTGE